MSVKKSRLFSKIVTGVVTTILAPAMASLVAQQMSQWQDTVKVVVEDHLPSLTAERTPHTSEGKARHIETGGRSMAPAAALLPPVSKSVDWSHVSSCSQ